MAKRKSSVVKTTFEQVPLAVAKRIARMESIESYSGLIACVICGEPVDLERCKTDERGKAVHQSCHLADILRQSEKKFAGRR